MIELRRIAAVILTVLAVLMCIVGCGNAVDGPGMVNTEYDQGY